MEANSCVYLVNGQLNQACPVIRLKINSGGQRALIEVFIDQENEADAADQMRFGAHFAG